MTDEAPDWMRHLEAAARSAARLDAMFEDETAWRMARTPICLHEAVSAAAARGLRTDGQTIMTVRSRGSARSGKEAWAGIGFFRIAKLVTGMPPESALSPAGYAEIIRRTNEIGTAGLAEVDQDANWKGRQNRPLAPLIDAARRYRELWAKAHSSKEEGLAARLALAPLLAAEGALSKPALFLGNAAPPLSTAILSSAAHSGAWMETFMPMLSSALVRTERLVRTLKRIHSSWEEKVVAGRKSHSLHHAALQAIFIHPLVSSADLAKAASEVPEASKMAERTAQKIIAEFAEARILRPLGEGRTGTGRAKARLWMANAPELLGS